MISIITINKDDSEGLKRTFASIRGQEGPSFEYVVIDGASNDGSVDEIQRNLDIVDSWVSEPDSGIYAAMNKGVKRSSGEYCLFLNSGDLLARPDTLSRIEAALSRDVDVLYSDTLIEEDGRERLSRNPRNLSPGYFLVNTLNHQNTVIKKSLLVEQGLYREDFKIASDWYLFMKASAERPIRFKFLPWPIVKYQSDGISATAAGSAINMKERAQGISEIFGGLMPVAEELMEFHESIYGSIVRHYGRTKILDFILRLYRLAARWSSHSKARRIR
jgi:glycosyltransferase involved in cell wall biosynthesis